MKKNIFRILSLVIIFALLFSVMVGCANGDDENVTTDPPAVDDPPAVNDDDDDDDVIAVEPPVAELPDGEGLSGTLSILSWHNEMTMQPILDGFNAIHPDVEIDLIFAPPIHDYIQQFRMMSATGTLPDIFVTAMENRTEVIEQGLAIDLSFLPVIERLSDANREAYSRDGIVYAVTFDGWIAGVFYNRALLAEHGISTPTNRTEYVAAMATLRENGVEPWGFSSTNLHDPIQGFLATETIANNRAYHAMVNDGELTFADGWTDPVNLWVTDYLEPGNINAEALGLTSDQVVEMFAFEEVAFIMGATWIVPTIDDLNPDLDYGMIPWFGTDGHTEWLTGAPGVGWSINAEAQNMAAAIAFMEYFSSDAALALFQDATGGLLAVEGIDFPIHPVIAEQFPLFLTGNIYLPAIEWRHSDAIGRELMLALHDVILGNITPDQIVINMDNTHVELDAALSD